MEIKAIAIDFKQQVPGIPSAFADGEGAVTLTAENYLFDELERIYKFAAAHKRAWAFYEAKEYQNERGYFEILNGYF